MLEAYQVTVRVTVYLIILIAVYNFIRSALIHRILTKISTGGVTSFENAKTCEELGITSPFEQYLLRDGSLLFKLIKIAGEEPGEFLKSKKVSLKGKRIYMEEDTLFGALVRWENKSLSKGIISLVIGSIALITASELVIYYWKEIYALIEALLNAF